jgi:hypothetical protein
MTVWGFFLALLMYRQYKKRNNSDILQRTNLRHCTCIHILICTGNDCILRRCMYAVSGSGWVRLAASQLCPCHGVNKGERGVTLLPGDPSPTQCMSWRGPTFAAVGSRSLYAECQAYKTYVHAKGPFDTRLFTLSDLPRYWYRVTWRPQ